MLRPFPPDGTVVLAGAVEAFAHGGGLDGYGCHLNRKAGGYHCHRGPLAGSSFASQAEMLEKLKQQPASAPTPAKR